MAKIKAFIISDFKDAGTGESFTAGAVAPVSEGAFKNYKAAGLVRLPTAADSKVTIPVPDASGD